jgi:hypothetical protein
LEDPCNLIIEIHALLVIQVNARSLALSFPLSLFKSRLGKK